jgi:hypothetical protein
MMDIHWTQVPQRLVANTQPNNLPQQGDNNKNVSGGLRARVHDSKAPMVEGTTEPLRAEAVSWLEEVFSHFDLLIKIFKILKIFRVINHRPIENPILSSFWFSLLPTVNLNVKKCEEQKRLAEK